MRPTTERGVTGPNELSAADRLRAWLVTGPLGRLAAFVLELAAALGRGLRRLLAGRGGR
jgi:hypothetical protein